MRDRGQEVAEGFERHVAEAAQMLARLHESLLDRDVLRAFLVRQRHAHERDTRAGTHAVGDRLLESIPVADAAEERQEQVGHRVVAALERRGEPEPFLVLGEQRASQRLAAEAVALVGDEQSAGRAGRHRLVCRRRVAGRDEHVAGVGTSRPLSPRRPMRALGQRGAEAVVPLLHEHPRRNEHEDEATASQCIGRGRDRDFGLARAGDRFDDPTAPAAQPGDERVELPSVQLAIP